MATEEVEWFAHGPCVLDRLFQTARCLEVTVAAPGQRCTVPQVRRSLSLSPAQTVTISPSPPRERTSLDRLALWPDGSIRHDGREVIPPVDHFDLDVLSSDVSLADAYDLHEIVEAYPWLRARPALARTLQDAHALVHSVTEELPDAALLVERRRGRFRR